jgi:glucose/mannose transport system substrate-binding protein
LGISLALALGCGALVACGGDDDGDGGGSAGGAGGAAGSTGEAGTGAVPEGGSGPGVGGEGGAPTGDIVKLEVYTWWSGDEEAAALDAAVAYHNQIADPDIELVNVRVRDKDYGNETLSKRMRANNPPDVFMDNFREPIFTYVGDSPTAPGTYLTDLNAIAADQGWDTALPDIIKAGVKKGDTYYAVPLNINRINSLWYSKKFAEKFKTQMETAKVKFPPTTWDEFIAVSEFIKTNEDVKKENGGVGVVPLSLAFGADWTAAQFTFENVLPAIAGPQFYTDFWTGKLGTAGGTMTAEAKTTLTDALERVRKLFCGTSGDENPINCTTAQAPSEICKADPENPKSNPNDPVCLGVGPGYINKNANVTGWPEPAKMLADGRAAMMAMGDWAKGKLIWYKMVPDQDFGSVPFPGAAGSQDIFVVGADAFAVPKSAAWKDSGLSLVRSVGTKEGQLNFNVVKGSIPARLDVDMEDERLDGMARDRIAEYKAAVTKKTAVVALGSLTKSADGGALAKYLAAELLEKGTITETVEWIDEEQYKTFK